MRRVASERFGAAEEQPGGGHTVLDLSGITFLEACAARVLLAARDQAALTETVLHVVAASGGVASRVLTLAGWPHEHEPPDPRPILVGTPPSRRPGGIPA